LGLNFFSSAPTVAPKFRPQKYSGREWQRGPTRHCPDRNQRTEQRPLLALPEGRKETCTAVAAATTGGEKGDAGKGRIRGRCARRSSGRGRAGWRLHAKELWDAEAEQDLMEELRREE
jgi:hypothetical protein